MLNRFLLFGLGLFSLFFWSCREDQAIAGGNLDLRFSTDTVFLDTVFETIGSSTYALKVYNDGNQKVEISQVALANPASPYRINVNGSAARQVTNVEILPRDSIYVFVEVTPAELPGQGQMVVTDQLLFQGRNGEQQAVELVTLAQEAVFHFPNRFLSIGSGENAVIVPYSLLSQSETWDGSIPHVIYGYLIVDSAATLNIQPGTNVHFHQNSGLWIFNDAQLKVAENAFPGQGDSVTFSSDRLEPGFENNAGQWGGVLGGIYLGQRARAVVNNAVIKNATTGLRTDSAVFNDQLSLTNSYILNCSRTGLFSGYSAVEADNVILANCGLYTFYAFGGNYRFRHCTFANFWTGNTRQEPAVFLTNFIDSEDGSGQSVRIVRDLENAYFGNCIISGNNENEFNFGEDPAGLMNFQFNNAALKLANDPEDRDFDVNGPRFNNVQVNATLDFRNVDNNRYALDSLSQVVNQGNTGDAQQLPSDIYGNPRNFNSVPDLGAIERQF